MPRPPKPPKSSAESPRPLASLIDNVPPHNLDAEKGVLGAMLLDPMVCDDVVALVKADDFYSDANRRLYTHIVAIHNDGGSGDVVLLAERLRQSNELEAIGSEAYLAHLMHEVQVTAHATHYANIVRDKSTLRRLIHTSATILSSAFDTNTQAQDIINRAAQDIFEVCEARTQNQVEHIRDVVKSVFEMIDRRNRGLADGISTGFSSLDSLIGGMHAGELIILAARPSMGKTALALNIADHVAVNGGKTVLVVSLEMSKAELAQRLICARGSVDSNKLKGSYLAKDETKHILAAADELSQAKLFIDDTPARSIAEISAIGRRLKRQESLALLVVDYLGLIAPDNQYDPRQEQVAKMARRLKGLARELHIPVLCLAQLNRQTELTKDNRPKLSHLRESGAIEQDADVVLFVHREERYHSHTDAESKGLLNKAELIVAKQRNGAVGEIELIWSGPFTRFYEKSNPNAENWSAGGNASSDVGTDAPQFATHSNLEE